MGKSLGYSIRDCSGGISCIVVAQPLKRRNGLVVTGAQCSIYGAGLALAHRLAVVGGNGQELFGGRRQHKLVGAIDFLRSEEHTSELQSLMRISYAVYCLQIKKMETLVARL